jgi:hypothetical protein
MTTQRMTVLFCDRCAGRGSIGYSKEEARAKARFQRHWVRWGNEDVCAKCVQLFHESLLNLDAGVN